MARFSKRIGFTIFITMVAACVSGAVAQDGENTNSCFASQPRDGVAHEPANRLDLFATGLEASETAKAVFLKPEALSSAHWCLENDKAAQEKSLQHWRNVAAAEGGAITDRYSNTKGTTTIYLIRVAAGNSTLLTKAGPRTVTNFAEVIDQPNELVIAGYFTGWPATETVFGPAVVHARINKVDGKTQINTGPN